MTACKLHAGTCTCKFTNIVEKFDTVWYVKSLTSEQTLRILLGSSHFVQRMSAFEEITSCPNIEAFPVGIHGCVLKY